MKINTSHGIAKVFYRKDENIYFKLDDKIYRMELNLPLNKNDFYDVSNAKECEKVSQPQIGDLVMTSFWNKPCFVVDVLGNRVKLDDTANITLALPKNTYLLKRADLDNLYEGMPLWIANYDYGDFDKRFKTSIDRFNEEKIWFFHDGDKYEMDRIFLGLNEEGNLLADIRDAELIKKGGDSDNMFTVNKEKNQIIVANSTFDGWSVVKLEDLKKELKEAGYDVVIERKKVNVENGQLWRTNNVNVIPIILKEDEWYLLGLYDDLSLYSDRVRSYDVINEYLNENFKYIRNLNEDFKKLIKGE